MNLLPWKRSRPAASTGAELALAQRILVLEEGAASASVDYLLLPHLLQQGPPLLRVDSGSPPPRGAIAAGDFVVIARYLPPAWRAQIARSRGQLAGLAWFMDDDLADARALRTLPAAYARKLTALALRQRPWLERAGAQWWVSSQALADKYALHQPLLLPLDPLPALRPRADACTGRADVVRIAYHGSASHMREHIWLRDVLAQVQAQCPHTHVEVIGDLAINRLWRDLPRVSVLHPMRWPNYLAHTHSQRADIGLAPLLPSAFNAGRGAVKFYDYARMGAFGIFADAPPYRSLVTDGVNGLLLMMDHEAWVTALLALAEDAQQRKRLAAAVAAATAQP